MTNENMNEDRPVIDLHDVLKQRVEAGYPICINGSTTPATEAIIDGLAKETGKPVKVVQIVALSDLSQLHNVTAEQADAVLRNASVKIALKS